MKTVKKRSPEPILEMKDDLYNPLVDHPIWYVHPVNKQVKEEGKTLMRYAETNTVFAPAAVASISVPSDEQKKIDYLNDRATAVYHNIERSFTAMFNLYRKHQPVYYKDLIDAIKNGEFTINEKEAKYADLSWKEFKDKEDDNYYDYDVFYGIDFTKFPKADHAAYAKARNELKDELQKVKDIIAIKSADAALEAVQAFEKWKPSNAPTVQ